MMIVLSSIVSRRDWHTGIIDLGLIGYLPILPFNLDIEVQAHVVGVGWLLGTLMPMINSVLLSI